MVLMSSSYSGIENTMRGEGVIMFLKSLWMQSVSGCNEPKLTGAD